MDSTTPSPVPEPVNVHVPEPEPEPVYEHKYCKTSECKNLCSPPFWLFDRCTECVPRCDLCKVRPIVFGFTRCFNHLLCRICKVNDADPRSYFCYSCSSTFPCSICKINKRVLLDICANCIHHRRN